MAAEMQGERTRNPTTVERESDRELVVTRVVNGPAPIVFDAWTKPELFRRWWAPESSGITIVACQLDARTGGSYRLELSHPTWEQPRAFFGEYIEVTPHARLIWTNDEGGEGGAVTTVTFRDQGDTTLVVAHDRYSSKEALNEAIDSGGTSGWDEQFAQLDEFVRSELQG